LSMAFSMTRRNSAIVTMIDNYVVPVIEG
jgi:hypothetical protein